MHTSPTEVVQVGMADGCIVKCLCDVAERVEVVDDRFENILGQNSLQGENIGERDVTERGVASTELPELVVLMQSFHRIDDPLYRKRDFLAECFESLPSGGFLCVADTFVSRMAETEDAQRELKETWADRGEMGYSLTLWRELDSVDARSLSEAQEIAEDTRESIVETGADATVRDGVCFVTMEWLEKCARDVGFDVVLSEPCSPLRDYVVLLKKPQ